ncbi:Uncharacterised protein [Mycobacterium tuberculosis]|nr:Uncharacterised protein [Mycobacterium tuberculosis]
MVSCPIRSTGPKAASPTRSIDSFSGPYDRFGETVSRIVQSSPRRRRIVTVPEIVDPTQRWMDSRSMSDCGSSQRPSYMRRPRRRPCS